MIQEIDTLIYSAATYLWRLFNQLIFFFSFSRSHRWMTPLFFLDTAKAFSISLLLGVVFLSKNCLKILFISSNSSLDHLWRFADGLRFLVLSGPEIRIEISHQYLGKRLGLWPPKFSVNNKQILTWQFFIKFRLFFWIIWNVLFIFTNSPDFFNSVFSPLFNLLLRLLLRPLQLILVRVALYQF